jgi:hypothetical protein
MATQKYMGRGELIDRLTAQVGGNKDVAIGILKKRGQMNDKGELTAAGEARNNMTAEERAKDRVSKREGVSTSKLIYNPRTNTARRR